jgi:hypothetical protein
MAADRPLKSLLIASLAGTAVAFSGVPLPAFRSGALSLSQSSAAASSAFSLGSAQSVRKGALTGMTMSLSKDDYATAMSKAVENDRDLDHIFRNNKMVGAPRPRSPHTPPARFPGESSIPLNPASHFSRGGGREADRARHRAGARHVSRCRPCMHAADAEPAHARLQC